MRDRLYERKSLVLLVIIDLGYDQISICIKKRERAELFVDSKIPNAAPFWISFFESYLRETAQQNITLGFFVLLNQTAFLQVRKNFFPLKDARNVFHGRF